MPIIPLKLPKPNIKTVFLIFVNVFLSKSAGLYCFFVFLVGADFTFDNSGAQPVRSTARLGYKGVYRNGRVDTFSKIPPLRLDYDGHYLCTVAACGDKSVVKPLRAGKRRGRLIVVNRQLLVANAFEDLIAERTPRLYRFVRNVYDKIGLPISKHITTARSSNVVYFIMKPLEWFLFWCFICLIVLPKTG